MNKVECKRIIKRAYKNIIEFNKEVNAENLEDEIRKVALEDVEECIVYSKLALNTLKHSANIITQKELVEEFDVMKRLYPKLVTAKIFLD